MSNPLVRPIPTGTVTFLFTDIEGSTKLWELYPRAMQAALARHDNLLRAAIESHGGYVFKTMGDAFCASFDTPPDALGAALDAQHSLHLEQWPEVIGDVRVRMALHTGVVERQDGDYFGQPLNRVARILAAGHGGQVLLSEVTYGLVRDNLPQRVTATDLGEHRLKDLFRPEHIFQLTAPDIPSDFPSLRTLDSRPNNLPVQPTPLIGREKELAAAEQRLMREDTRLLTLSGPGGTGKTRLALQVGADLLDSFKDGVWFVNLAPITDPALVIPTIAQALDIRETGNTPIAEVLKRYLREKEMLLLLDNFEQVIEAAPQVADVISVAPRARIVATSRERLQLRGEKEYGVPPLAVPDPRHLPRLEQLSQYEAVRLFIDRATDTKPAFQVTNDNAPAVAEICVRLDGLPLAIELAAARIKILPPQAMLSRLQNRLKVLTGGSRDTPTRQQTLRSTLEWSYDLLSPAEQRLFRRLAVFQGGRTLEAIEAICNAEGDLGIEVLDGVQSLVDKNLLKEVEGGGDYPRLVMLETIHEYAREKLQESGEWERLRSVHAQYFLDWVEAREGGQYAADEVERLEWLEAEHDNVRAVLGWAEERGDIELGLRVAGAMADFWETRGYPSEGRERLSTWLSRADKTSHTLACAKALHGAGSLAWAQSDYASALPLLTESLTLFRELGDKSRMAPTLNKLGGVTGFAGDHALERSFYEESLALCRELGDKRGVAWALTNLGCAVNAQGDPDYAYSLLEEALVLQREVGGKRGLGFTLENLGEAAHQRGDYRAARSAWEESLAVHRDLGNKHRVTISLFGIGYIQLRDGEDDRAIADFREGLLLSQEVGFKYGVAACLAGLAGVAAAYGSKQTKGMAERAGRLLGATRALLEAIGAEFYPVVRMEYDRYLAIAQTQLDDGAWAKAWEDGRAMSTEQAIAYALGNTGDK